MPMTSEELRSNLIKKINELANFQVAGQYTACDKVWQDIHSILKELDALSYNEGLKKAETVLKQQMSLKSEMIRYIERRDKIRELKKRMPNYVYERILKETLEQTKKVPILKKVKAKRSILALDPKYVKNSIYTKNKRTIKKFDD